MSSSSSPPHLVLIPSAGMGHIAPFCRLAAALSSRNSSVSFITTTLPTVSSAESLHTSHLISSFPSIHLLHLPLSPLPPSQFPPDSDPFYLRYESIRSSAHLLPPLLSSSPPVSALIVDIGISSAFIPIAHQLNVPCFVLFTTSAAMLSLYAYLPTYFSTSDVVGDIHIPGVCTFPKSSVLPGMDNRNHFFARQVIHNSLSFANADGILVNTFEAIESERLAALNAKKVTPDLPPVIPIGPLKPIRVSSLSSSSSSSSYSRWLDEQPPRSVVYVSFGSRTAMAAEQIKELGIGLERSGQRFLWVIKTKKVDREEESKLEEILGEGYRERVKGRGLVVNGWVEQEQVLKHEAIGGFLSHCGWNSVMEAAMAGVMVMAWPRGADQRVNGELVRRSGMGVWMEGWWWEAEEGVVGGEEIGRRVREMMEDGGRGLREKVERVAAEARKAGEVGGSSYRNLEEFVSRFVSTSEEFSEHHCKV